MESSCSQTPVAQPVASGLLAVLVLRQWNQLQVKACLWTVEWAHVAAPARLEARKAKTTKVAPCKAQVAIELGGCRGRGSRYALR